MAGAFHGPSEPECVINLGVSGPGVVNHAVMNAGPVDLGQLAEIIKKIVFKITRAGELIGRETARRLGVQFGILDVSLAPTPEPGDSIGDILKHMGLDIVEQAGKGGDQPLLRMGHGDLPFSMRRFRASKRPLTTAGGQLALGSFG